MEQESQRQSFVVSIWLEETVSEAGVATWRGQITHVPSGTQSYIKRLSDLSVFIAPYLQEMGVQLDCLDRPPRVQVKLVRFVGSLLAEFYQLFNSTWNDQRSSRNVTFVVFTRLYVWYT
jgi:hypothetical protein